MELFLKYIILGFFQGIFEWLPISSEGVVSLISNFWKFENPIDIGLFLHLGTILAVLIYFFQDWKKIFKDKDLLTFLIISTSVSLLIGYPIYRAIQSVVFGNSLLFLVGFGLLFTAYFNKKKISFNFNEKYFAIIVGLLQALSVIPGLSRSGSTIFGLSLGKKDNEEILKISYMMSVPVGLAANFYLLLNNQVLIFNAWPSIISAFVTGILTLKILMSLSKKINFFWFALFFSFLCFGGGILGLIFS